jgi:uncharacterized protein YjcR
MQSLMSNKRRLLHASKRCLAQTRQGNSCQSPAVKEKKRCHMHGGAQGSGAPKGNQNAFKHGHYSAQALYQRREIRKMLKDIAQFLKDL